MPAGVHACPVSSRPSWLFAARAGSAEVAVAAIAGVLPTLAHMARSQSVGRQGSMDHRQL